MAGVDTYLDVQRTSQLLHNPPHVAFCDSPAVDRPSIHSRNAGRELAYKRRLAQRRTRSEVRQGHGGRLTLTFPMAPGGWARPSHNASALDQHAGVASRRSRESMSLVSERGIVLVRAVWRRMLVPFRGSRQAENAHGEG